MRWITGEVVYVDLGPGFFGVKGEDGKDYRPVQFPEQLKTTGAKVSLLVKPSDKMSMLMWGQAVDVKGFKTI